MADLSKQELDILKQTFRAIRWQRYSRWVELSLGVSVLGFTFWAANDPEVLTWFVGGGGIFGLLGALGASAVVSAVRDSGHKRDKLLVKLADIRDASVT